MALNDGKYDGNLTSANYISHTIQGNSAINFNDDSEDIAKLIRANGIYDRQKMDWYKKFSRFGIIDPYNTMTTTKEYIFITKPDLNIFSGAGLSSGLANETLFVDAYNRYRPVLEQLQYSYNKTSGPFIPLLSNSINSGLDLPGITAETIETSSNIYGTHLTYRGTSMKSDEDFEFTTEFTDTKFLEVYEFFKLYDEYERLKWLGMVGPPNSSYIYNKILHDQMAVYKFVVGEDGETLIYWARIVGAYPISVPREAFSDMNNNDGQKISINWKGQFVRDMDIRILYAFNRIVGADNISYLKDLPLYDIEGHHVNGSWSSVPYIAHSTNLSGMSQKEKMGSLYLKWKE